MPDFYYQIKGKDEEHSGLSNWAWPPLFSGKVEAKDKKQAKLLIEEEYGRAFPLRVLTKDLDDHHYLLSIREIAEDDERTRGLFEIRECKQCETKFRQIDLYNDHNERYKGQEFCSHTCRNRYEQNNRSDREFSSLAYCKEQPVIYQIRNIKTEMSYIGKTYQVFTLRWYQHFYHGGSCKFHTAIKEFPIEDWEFRIVESIDVPEGVDRDTYVAERESFWINKLDTIDKGYNTASVLPEQNPETNAKS